MSNYVFENRAGRALVLCLGIAMGVGSLWGQAAAKAPMPESAKDEIEQVDKVSAERIAKLVSQLGSDSFEEREKATKELETIGGPALDALRIVLQSDDAEVKRRAVDLVRKIEIQVDSAKITKPTKIHLVYKDTPVAEAVADLAKKSGYDIVLGGDKSNLADRRVTLDTDKTTFWQAFDAFCLKANLVEEDPSVHVPKVIPVAPFVPRIRGGILPVIPRNQIEIKEKFSAEETPKADEKKPIRPPVIVVPPAVIGRLGGSLQVLKGQDSHDGHIVLVDGKPTVLPTHYSGVFRIRVLPTNPLLAAKGKNETAVALELRAEPRIRAHLVRNVRVERAIDEQGEALAQVPMVELVPARPVLGGFGGGAPRFAPPPLPAHRGVAENRTITSIQLKLGKTKAKSLKELKGKLDTDVVTAPEPLITVDNVLKSAGQTFKGKHGGAIIVKAASTQKTGHVSVNFDLEEDLGIDPGSTLLLLDNNGKRITQVGSSASVTVINNVVSKNFTLSFQPGKEQIPAKLVYSCSRRHRIEVPFALNDVPLP